MRFKGEKGKAQRIRDAVRADILSGKLRPGDRVKSVRGLAADFKVSLKSAQCALDVLSEEGLIERKRGSGTFVKRVETATDGTIYFLVPNASHITSNHESSVVLRRLLHGAIMATKPGQLVQSLPVSRADATSLRRSPDAIDWAGLERISPGSNVFVSGMWYGPILPFLIERGVRGVFLANQFECEYPDTWAMIREAAWPVLTVDRRAAIRNVVEHLHDLGKRRIAALKRCVNQPDHPFLLGFKDGCESRGVPFVAEAFREFAPPLERADLGDLLGGLRNHVDFDALIVCDPNIAVSALKTIRERIGVTVPDDVAVIAHRDMPGYVDASPSLSAFDFPWVDVGREIPALFNDVAASGASVKFQASIIDRGSTVKNLDGSSSKSFIPELAENSAELSREVV